MQRLVILILAFFCSSAMAQDVAQCNRLTVAGAEQWRPFAYTVKSPNPTAKGIAHDVVKIIGAELNLSVRQRLEIPWKRIEFQLEQGQIDILAGNYWTQERADKWLLTDPIASESVHLFTLRSKQFKFNSLNDLNGKIGVVPRGISLGADFDEARKTLKILEVRSHEQMYEMLSKQRVDYLVSPHYAAQKFLAKEQNQNVTMIDKPINTYDVHLSLSPKSPCALLLPRINEIIQDKKLDGSIDSIIQQYTE